MITYGYSTFPIKSIFIVNYICNIENSFTSFVAHRLDDCGDAIRCWT